jgi:hypothetical protein
LNPNDDTKAEMEKVHQAVQAKQQKELRWATGEPVTYEQQKHQIVQDHNAHMIAIILPVALAIVGIGWWLKRRKQLQNGGWQ